MHGRMGGSFEMRLLGKAQIHSGDSLGEARGRGVTSR